MNRQFSLLNIYHSFRKLKGNTRTSVLFEPLWGIPYLLYSFYLSLYMKSQGVSDAQIGFNIAIGFIAGAVFSLFGGIITDALGRRRTTLIFDLISWPGAVLIYLFAHNFWMFALGTAINSLSRITGVSWNLMVVEDASEEDTLTAYNLFNITNIALGVITPLAGLIIKWAGIVSGERILLGFTVVSMTVMMLGRNYYYRETRIGKRVLAERRRGKKKFSLHLGHFQDTFVTLKMKPLLWIVIGVVVLFNAYMPIGTFSSLYYAPYLTEALQLDKLDIAFLGGLGAAAIFFILVFVTPSFPYQHRIKYMTTGFAIQILALLWFIFSPPGSLLSAALCVVLFAVGYGVAKPFLDTFLPAYTDGKERSGIFALHNTLISLLGAAGGFVSGFLYNLKPQYIYYLSIAVLLLCIILLIVLSASHRKIALPEVNGGGMARPQGD